MESIQSFDLERLLQDFDGDHARLGELARSVLGELPHYLPRIRESIHAEQWHAVMNWSSLMHSFFSSFLAEEARAAAEALEQAAIRTQKDEIELAWTQLECTIDQFLSDLFVILNKS